MLPTTCSHPRRCDARTLKRKGTENVKLRTPVVRIPLDSIRILKPRRIRKRNVRSDIIRSGRIQMNVNTNVTNEKSLSARSIVRRGRREKYIFLIWGGVRGKKRKKKNPFVSRTAVYYRFCVGSKRFRFHAFDCPVGTRN